MHGKDQLCIATSNSKFGKLLESVSAWQNENAHILWNCAINFRMAEWKCTYHDKASECFPQQQFKCKALHGKDFFALRSNTLKAKPCAMNFCMAEWKSHIMIKPLNISNILKARPCMARIYFCISNILKANPCMAMIFSYLA